MSDTSGLVLRRIQAGDWQAIRTLRLQALADYPLGFVETLASARELGDDAWRARAARGAEQGDSFQVLALSGEVAVGTCVSFVRDEAAWLAAVFVAPDFRGRGLLDRLVGLCCAWAAEQGHDAMELEVHQDNPWARRAYERLGFAATGQTATYPLPPGGVELVMRRPLTR